MLRSCSSMSLSRNDASQRNQSSVSNKKSFAPSNYKFSLNMKSKNPNQTINKQNKTTKTIKEVEETKKATKETSKEESKEASKESIKEATKEATKEEAIDVQSKVEEEESPPEEVEVVRCQHFRNLLKSETERITELCERWEEVAKSEDLADDVAGEVRSVVGLGRLVMAERFAQFGGLIENCQFRKGEKETNVEDLQGFWEMIFLQVEDVDKKFFSLKELKDNNWERSEPKELSKVKKTKRPRNAVTGTVSQASSGLKALIAARRKAANKPVEAGDSTVPEEKKTGEESEESPGTPPANLHKQEPPQMTFDGGFFQVTSPCMRKTPNLKSSNLKLRQTAVNNNASASKLKPSQLLSPFISAMAKLSMSMSSGQSASRFLLRLKMAKLHPFVIIFYPIYYFVL